MSWHWESLEKCYTAYGCGVDAAMTSDRVIHIAYIGYDGTNIDIRYVEGVPGNWSTPLVLYTSTRSPYGSQEPDQVGIAADPDGNLIIVWEQSRWIDSKHCTTDIHYRLRVSGTWNQVGTITGGGVNFAVALASGARPVMLASVGSTTCFFPSNGPDFGAPQTLLVNTYSFTPGILLCPNGDIYVSYDAYVGNKKYLHKTTEAPIVFSSAVNDNCSVPMAWHPGGYPVAYLWAEPKKQGLWSLTGGTWQYEAAPDATDWAFGSHSMAIDQGGNFHFATYHGYLYRTAAGGWGLESFVPAYGGQMSIFAPPDGPLTIVQGGSGCNILVGTRSGSGIWQASPLGQFPHRQGPIGV